MASATFKPTTKDPMEKVKDAGNQALEKVKDAGNQALDKAKDTAETVGDMAKSAVSTVGEKADDYTAAAGHELKAAGDTMASKMPHEGMTGHASQALAATLQQSGRYLEEAKLSGMANDLADVVKAHPIPTILICFGIGFCLGRIMRD